MNVALAKLCVEFTPMKTGGVEHLFFYNTLPSTAIFILEMYTDVCHNILHECLQSCICNID